MDNYYTVIVSATVSVFLIFAASITLLRHSEQSTVTHNDNINSVAAKITVKDEKAVKLKVTFGESVYKSSVLHKYREKFSRKLERASDQRKKVCGVYVKYSIVDCSVCTLFFGGLQFLAERGSTQEDVAEFSKLVCINLKIADERVCSAITEEFKAELFGVVTKLALSPKEACGLLIGDGCGDPYDPFSMWNVTLPDVPKPPVIPPKPPAPGSPKMRVLHLTDIHLDPDYSPGSKADCGEPLCCRADDGPPDPGKAGAGKYGDYRGCDTYRPTLENLFQHLSSIQDQFDYVLFTGDLPPHNVWNQSRADQLTSLQTYTDLMKKYLPTKMVFNALGNHESAPVNSFPPPYITGKESESWLYDALAKSWTTWLPEETVETIKRGGFYAHSPYPGLRVISLNMNFCNSGNWWLLINTTDPAGMLEWLITELQDAENKGDKVQIIGHIMPGGGGCMKPFSWNYYKIISRYENTIVGQFFGHAHDSYYEVFYDDVTFQRPNNILYIPGSVTTYSNYNPGFRIYEIDGNYNGSSWRVQDYTNFFLNLTDANQSGNLNWQFEYRAKSEYGLQNLFPSDWNQLIYRMKDDDSLFQKYLRHYVKSAPHDDCTGDCKINKLCELKTGRVDDPNLCKDLKMGL